MPFYFSIKLKKIMKKLVLTLIAGFCIGGVAIAQEPAKATTRKKVSSGAVSTAPAEVEKRDKAKIARAKAAAEQKAAGTTSAKSSG
jgi:hypothetical protein